MATDSEIQDCWDKSLIAFGTSHIFNRRFIVNQRKLRLLLFFGITVPVSVAGVVAALFGIDSIKQYLAGMIVVASILSLIQLIFTIWSILAKWEHYSNYGLESSIDNNEIYRQYKELAEKQPNDFEQKYVLLNQKNDLRSEQDNRQGISDSEKRRGMRAALRQFKRRCAYPQCSTVPYDLTPTDCPVCGSYGILFRVKKLLYLQPKLLKAGDNNNE
jgi:mobilome CxxCx(11)CxxC protein